jgi:hypothetical protein
VGENPTVCVGNAKEHTVDAHGQGTSSLSRDGKPYQR